METYYLPYGYGHGRKIAYDHDVFADAVKEEVDRLAPFVDEEETILVMAGGDHERPDPLLPDLVEALGPAARISSLEEHLGAWRAPGDEWVGELRSAAWANLLPNTYSVRPNQKTQRARAEHRLERYAEPLAALVPGQEWPAGELLRAWNLLHLNGAHDSVCGCSTDGVADAVDRRTDEVLSIATAIAGRAMQALADSMREQGSVAFNPSPFERDGVPALGWKLNVAAPAIEPLPIEAGDGAATIPIGGREVAVRLMDQADDGDLYTFSPNGSEELAHSIDILDGEAVFEFERFTARMRASMGPTATMARLDLDIDNRAPNHRVRLVLDLPEPSGTTRAGAPFEIVTRSRLGEGGVSEPPSPDWPARGFVLAGGVGFLSEGVFEYELREGDALAMTLMRCVGTISKKELATRSVVAGPDVATPEAQLIGAQSFLVGVTAVDPGEDIVATWERFALPLLTAVAPGGGNLEPQGSLLDIEAPALSSVRVVDGARQARIWNPWARGVRAQVGGTRIDLGPYRIEDITIR